MFVFLNAANWILFCWNYWHLEMSQLHCDPTEHCAVQWGRLCCFCCYLVRCQSVQVAEQLQSTTTQLLLLQGQPEYKKPKGMSVKSRHLIKDLNSDTRSWPEMLLTVRLDICLSLFTARRHKLTRNWLIWGHPQGHIELLTRLPSKLIIF